MAIELGVNAYIELAVFKAWCDDRAYDYSSFSDSAINGAIVISSVDFIDVNYTFLGTSLTQTQLMQLPTDQVTIANIENGAAQAVWQQLNGVLLIDQSTIDVKGQVTKTVDEIDVLKEEREYAEGTQKTNTVSTIRIDRALAKYTVGGSQGGAVRVL